jgi:hypothetical protein
MSRCARTDAKPDRVGSCTVGPEELHAGVATSFRLQHRARYRKPAIVFHVGLCRVKVQLRKLTLTPLPNRSEEAGYMIIMRFFEFRRQLDYKAARLGGVVFVAD